MLTIARVARDGIRSFARGFVRDEAQDVFEYVLIIGILTVAVLVAVATPFGQSMIEAIVEGTCTSLDEVSDAANGGTTPNGIMTAGGVTCANLIPDPAP
jgi:hypothetical protein